jgi:Uma2 family endonuclease
MKLGIIPRMTLEELDRLPDDFNRYELLAGELFVTPAPRTRHQIIVTRLTDAMSPYVRRKKLGLVLAAPVDVTLEQEGRVQPDVLFITRERLDIVTKEGVLGPPDLVVEILSESSSSADRKDKRDLYKRSGVKEYWIVDPEQDSMLLYRWSEGADPARLGPAATLTTPPIPGLRIRLKAVFSKRI